MMYLMPHLKRPPFIAFNQPISMLLALFIQSVFSTNQASQQNDGNFTIVGGQIYTPGLAIIDSPQPFTPEGGGTITFSVLPIASYLNRSYGLQSPFLALFFKPIFATRALACSSIATVGSAFRFQRPSHWPPNACSSLAQYTGVGLVSPHVENLTI